MVKILQTISVLSLAFAGIVLVLCAVQWLQGIPETERDSTLTIREKFRRAGSNSEKDGRIAFSPLVEQARAFALYLNPLEPLEPKETQAQKVSVTRAVSVARPSEPEQKITLVATSYYRSKPEKSMALVSEPGSGFRWVKQGAHLGHSVVEEVKRGAIVYREGGQSYEMAVDTKIRVHTEQVRQTMLASSETHTSQPKVSTPYKPRTSPRKLLQKFGLPRPEMRLVAYDHERRGQ